MAMALPIFMAAGSMMAQQAGNQSASNQISQATAAQQAALNNILQMYSPTAQNLQVALQQEVNSGKMSPQTLGAINQQNSQLNNITINPALVQAQMQALATLQRQGQGGLNATDLSDMIQAQQQANQQSQAAQQSIIQDLQSRGQNVQGGGAELAARLSAAQNAMNQGSVNDINIGAQAQQRALQAIASAGQLGNQIDNQSFNQQAQIAAAQDAINRYNAQNAQQVGQYNNSNVNEAQLYNLQNQQAINNANTGIANQQAMYNAQTNQQAYQDLLGKYQAAADQTQNVANMNLYNAQNSANGANQIAQGLGQAGTALAGYYTNSSNNSSENNDSSNNNTSSNSSPFGNSYNFGVNTSSNLNDW